MRLGDLQECLDLKILGYVPVMVLTAIFEALGQYDGESIVGDTFQSRLSISINKAVTVMGWNQRHRFHLPAYDGFLQVVLPTAYFGFTVATGMNRELLLRMDVLDQLLISAMCIAIKHSV